MTTIAADRGPRDRAYNKAYPGGTTPFGAPNFVLAQMYANAIDEGVQGRQDQPRRGSQEPRQGGAPKPTILGTPIAFDKNGDVAGATFHIFKIQSDGSYKTVS